MYTGVRKFIGQLFSIKDQDEKMKFKKQFVRCLELNQLRWGKKKKIEILLLSDPDWQNASLATADAL